MTDPTPTPSDTIATLEVEVDLEKRRNDEILRLLSMMDRLWPDDEKGKVQSLAAQAEATKSVLQDCSERLEKLK